MQSERRGDWIQTYTGKRFWPLDPRPEDIDIRDIAHALSLQCRYGGHCIRFYSVAEHSVLMAGYMATEIKPWALMHDAAEAYLGDWVRPLKRSIPGYADMERRVLHAIAERFVLPYQIPWVVHEADNCMLADERENLDECEVDWAARYEPLGVRLRYWLPWQAEQEFLRMFRRLFHPET